jgi:hypothetical protein
MCFTSEPGAVMRFFSWTLYMFSIIIFSGYMTDYLGNLWAHLLDLQILINADNEIDLLFHTDMKSAVDSRNLSLFLFLIGLNFSSMADQNDMKDELDEIKEKI